ncbi:MAG: VCBS repeat-containing protein [Bacteroidota bacterium]
MKSWKYLNKLAFVVGLCSLLLSCEQNKQQADNQLFQALSPSQTGIDFKNELAESEAFNIIEYLYFYNGGGIAAGDINQDGLLDLYFTSNQGTEQLYLNRGKLQFEDITQKAGVAGETGIEKWTSGAMMVDINADGYLDIYVCEVANYKMLKGKNRLYINQGDLTFKEAAADYGLDISSYSQHTAFLDYDLDGDLDLFLLNHAVHTPESYKKSVIRAIKDSLAGDRLYRNENGRFVDITEEAGIYSGAMGYGLSVSVADLNQDHFPDIYVTNDFHENDYLYLNQGDGTFKESIQTLTGHLSTFAMGSDLADFNNDGWIDILTVDMKPDQEPILKSSAGVDPYEIYRYKRSFGYHDQYSRNMLQLNRGQLPNMDNIRFSEIGQFAGIDATDWSWSSLFADLDNDGQKDIFISNGIPKRPNDLDYIRYLSSANAKDNLPALEMIQNMPDGRYRNKAFQNQGLKYEEVSSPWGLDKLGYSNGAIYADLEGDGDLDLVLNNWGETASIFENRSNEISENNYLKIKLKGRLENQNGVGVSVKLFVGGEQQIVENQINRGWLSSVNEAVLHFGLGEAAQIDSIYVDWGKDGFQVLKDVAANQIIEVDIEAAVDTKTIPVIPTERLFKKINNSGINFQHKELFYNDFSNEKLLPRALSTEGPKLAIGDVNADGLEDFYICGAKGQTGAIYLQQAKGMPFQRLANPSFQQQQMKEAIDAAFFDADADGDLDLYVLHAGGELSSGFALQDHLYLNDGKGQFSYAKNALPQLDFNGAFVLPFDANKDGHIDLFVGHRAIPNAYGKAGESVLLLNNGKGQFRDATKDFFGENADIGMLTDGIWLEEERTMVLVGDWMPISFFHFTKEGVKKEEIPNSRGWWKSIASNDIDQDGDLDILLGNEGLNTNLSASPTKPLELYISDFDGNQASDPIMAYYKNEQQWVYPDLDLLAKQIVSVRKTYTDYKSFAQKSFKEVFPPAYLEKSTQLQVEQLASVYLLNEDGEYKVHTLPEEVQWSCVQAFASADFDQEGAMDVLAAGNFQANTTSIGKSDASFGHFLRWEEDHLRSVALQEVGFAVEGNVQAIEMLKANGTAKYVVVARNDGGVDCFSFGRE